MSRQLINRRQTLAPCICPEDWVGRVNSLHEPGSRALDSVLTLKWLPAQEIVTAIVENSAQRPFPRNGICGVLVFSRDTEPVGYTHTHTHTQHTHTQLALNILGLCIHRFNQQWIKNIGRKKIPESFKKQNLNLLCADNYLHSIYIVFMTIYITFILY